MRDQLAATSGVVSASMAVVPAMTDSNWSSSVNVQGYERKEGEDMTPSVNAAGPAYFATMGMALVRGREFRATDGDGAPKVAIGNSSGWSRCCQCSSARSRRSSPPSASTVSRRTRCRDAPARSGSGWRLGPSARPSCGWSCGRWR